MNKGKDFEKQWQESYKNTPYLFIRLKDSNKWSNSKQTRFTPQNPYDGIQYSTPFLFLLELKSTGGSSFNFNPQKPCESSNNKSLMIKPHQVKGLMDAINKEGVIAGLILNFRPRKLKTKETDNATYFVHIIDFLKFAVESNKSSINEKDCINIGAIKIDQKKKRVKYKYNIEKFVIDVVHYCFQKKYLKSNILDSINKWREEFKTYEFFNNQHLNKGE
jgi:hypothetical protein